MQHHWTGYFLYRSYEGLEERRVAVVSSELEGEELPPMPRVRLISTGSTGSIARAAERIDAVLESREPLRASILSVSFPIDASTVQRVFANGFQSWTESRELERHERLRGLNPLLYPATHRYRLEHFGDYRFSSYPAKRGMSHGWSFFYFLRRQEEHTVKGEAAAGAEPKTSRSIELWGSLDETSGYTRFVWDWRRGILTVEKECEGQLLEGGELLLSLRILRGGEAETFDHYFSHFGEPVDPEPKAGWSSWYRYYNEVDEDAVRINLEAFRSRGVPLDVFQIDDGWQRSVGDWLEVDESFPSGMAAIASMIKDAGYTPGLWIAPFVAEESSQLFREHPDWFVNDGTGDPLVVGYNPFHWRGRFYALDFLYPQVYEYLRRVFAAIFEEWGFRFVKLDYLFAAALLPREGKSRGRIMFEALRMLREFTGERMSLGCGVPLGSAFGLFDYCRIAADAAPYWEDAKLALAGYRERTSTRNALRSIIGRRQLSGRAFGNDPDVFILRERDQKMSEQQRRTLFLVNLVYGRLHFTSDNPAEYDEETWKLYLSMFPLRRTEILQADESQAFFKAGQQSYRLYHNLERKRREAEVPEGLYYGFGEGFFSGGTVQLEPYESRLYLEVDVKPYAVAGSTGLALPGSEVEEFRFDEGRIDFRISSGVLQEGNIFLKVPSFLSHCTVNGTSYPCEEKVDMSLVVVPREKS